MSTKTLLKSLKILVDCDKNIFQTEEAIKTAKSVIEKQQKQISQLQQMLDFKKNICTQERKNVGHLELQAAEFKTAEDEKRNRLHNIRDQKEYKAIEKELQVIVNQRNTQEDALVRSWHTLEQATKNLEQETIATQKNLELINEEIKKQQNLILEYTDKAKLLTKERGDAATQIPEEWLVRYKRMQNTVPDPIVPVQSNCCSACFYSIVPQDLTSLKKGAIIPCHSCYRFLYLEAEIEQNEKQATY